MKITKVNYMEGEARFCTDEFPKLVFCIKLEGKTTQNEVLDELKLKIPPPDTTEQTFKDLKLKDLEGSEINA